VICHGGNRKLRWSLVEPPEHLSQEHHAVGVGERDVIGRVKSVSRRLSRHREVADRRIAAPDLDDFILDESFLVGERQLLAYPSVDLFWGEENVEDGRYRVGPLSSGSKSWKTPANGLKRCWFEERSVSPGINGGCSSPRSRWKCARAIRVRQNAASGGDARPSPRGFANSGQACAGSRQVGRLGDPGQKSLDCEANGHQGHQGVGPSKKAIRSTQSHNDTNRVSSETDNRLADRGRRRLGYRRRNKLGIEGN